MLGVLRSSSHQKKVNSASCEDLQKLNRQISGSADCPDEDSGREKLSLGKHWMYEPKWDGFRCFVFRDNENIFLQNINAFIEAGLATAGANRK